MAQRQALHIVVGESSRGMKIKNRCGSPCRSLKTSQNHMKSWVMISSFPTQNNSKFRLKSIYITYPGQLWQERQTKPMAVALCKHEGITCIPKGIMCTDWPSLIMHVLSLSLSRVMQLLRLLRYKEHYQRRLQYNFNCFWYGARLCR